jgi:hypothetical protein
MSRLGILWDGALLAGLVIGTGCGASGGSPSAKAPSVHVVASGQTNCPADQVQDLTFTGSFVGHLTCQAKPSFCYWDPLKADLTNSLHTHMTANIPVLVDGKPATVAISPGDQYGKAALGPATYEVPSSHPGDFEPQFDLQLADMSNWQSEGSGVVATLTDDGKRVTGTVKGSLNYTSRATISGKWACVRQNG